MKLHWHPWDADKTGFELRQKGLDAHVYRVSRKWWWSVKRLGPDVEVRRVEGPADTPKQGRERVARIIGLVWPELLEGPST